MYLLKQIRHRLQLQLAAIDCKTVATEIELSSIVTGDTEHSSTVTGESEQSSTVTAETEVIDCNC